MLMSSVAYAFLSYITLLMLWFPVPFHFRVKNAAILVIVGWTTLGNIVEAAAALSLLDATDIINPSWCDLGSYEEFLT